MKRSLASYLFFLFTLLTFFNMKARSQQPVKTYAKEWKKVDDFVRKELPKSALQK